MNIIDLGWNEHFSQEFQNFDGGDGLIPARVAKQNKQNYEILCELGNLNAHLSGSFSFFTESNADYPAVGDWIIVSKLPGEDKAIIHKLLARKTSFTRKIAGDKTEKQIIAANIDIVFLVVGLDRNFNLRRIERYLTLINRCGADLVILLNKSDVCRDVDARVQEVTEIAGDCPIHKLSAINDSCDFLSSYITRGKTVTMVGSSGTGKTTIINRILGENILQTGETSQKVSQGRHTTTWRELIVLPNGGIVIDTPGMRELQLWSDEEDLAKAFDDIEELSKNCKFRDCKHQEEPGCAVLQAIENGDLDSKRLVNYIKMSKEIRFLENRKEQRLAMKKSWGKSISKLSKQHHKLKLKGRF